MRSGWAVADDTDPLTGPSPATGTPTVPGRTVSNYDALSAPAPAASPFTAGAYETGDVTTSPAAAGWPEPPSPSPSPSGGSGAQATWPPRTTGSSRRRTTTAGAAIGGPPTRIIRTTTTGDL
ncbi:hypothetical protein ACFQYP_05615 [Nonomuraea antimicrobica]